MGLYNKYGNNPFSLFARRNKAKAVTMDKPSYDLTPQVGLAVFSGLALVGVGIGSTIGTYVFFGTVTFIGLVALIESNPRLKWLAKRSSRGIDVLIFTGSVVAMFQVGITAAAALTFAGLAYTLIYSPFLRSIK